jgi:hypothetical protein
VFSRNISLSYYLLGVNLFELLYTHILTSATNRVKWAHTVIANKLLRTFISSSKLQTLRRVFASVSLINNSSPHIYIYMPPPLCVRWLLILMQTRPCVRAQILLQP